MAAPHSLKPVETYFMRANELSGAHPFVAYYVRKFGFELAMKMKGPDAGNFLLAQMEILEAGKGTIKPPLYQPPPYPDPNWKPPPPPAPPPQAEPEASAATVDEPTPAPAPTTDAGAAEAPKSGGIFSFMSKQPPKTTTNDVAAAQDGVSSLSVAEPKPKPAGDNASAAAAPPPPSPPPTAPMITPPKVAATPQQALRMLALDLYERARQADKPSVFPSPSTTFGVSEAPRIARGLHAAAVLLDAMKQFDPKLPADLERFQLAAHARSSKLGAQINSAFKFKEDEPIPLKWRPADLSAPTPLPPAPPPPPPPMEASLFPSVPR